MDSVILSFSNLFGEFIEYKASAHGIDKYVDGQYRTTISFQRIAYVVRVQNVLHVTGIRSGKLTTLELS